MQSPEVANSIKTGRFSTNYHDLGSGEPVVLIHGSGPGVTGWANWRLVLPELSKRFRVLAPDMAGFGFTERVDDYSYTRDNWVEQVKDFLDALGIEKVHLVGNSFGGAITLAFAIRYPERVGKFVLMGAAGIQYPIPDALEAVWGYEPSIDAMRKLLDIFAYDRTLVTDELAKLRYEASIQPGFQEAFSKMFPAPRQRWLDALASDEKKIGSLPHEALVIHGREDIVVPMEISVRLHRLLQRSQLHVFGQCGHWTQIERTADFNRLVGDFFSIGG
ncbi:alpha/beta fold hydrolase [Sphingomonas oryzagri]